jgi:anthranilate/para-aminobenzoate synthase component II
MLILILGTILGICLGNSKLRHQIGDEILKIVYHNEQQENKQTKTYNTRSEKRKVRIVRLNQKYTTAEPRKEAVLKNTKLCKNCSEPIEPLYKMPGYYFCHKCEKVVTPKKVEV